MDEDHPAQAWSDSFTKLDCWPEVRAILYAMMNTGVRRDSHGQESEKLKAVEPGIQACSFWRGAFCFCYER